jgi:hypothetical protein
MALIDAALHRKVPNGMSIADWKFLFMGLSSSPLHTPYPGEPDLFQTAQWDRAPTDREGRPASWTVQSGFNVYPTTPAADENVACKKTTRKNRLWPLS